MNLQFHKMVLTMQSVPRVFVSLFVLVTVMFMLLSFDFVPKIEMHLIYKA